MKKKSGYVSSRNVKVHHKLRELVLPLNLHVDLVPLPYTCITSDDASTEFNIIHVYNLDAEIHDYING